MEKYYFSVGAVSDKGYVKEINQDNILIKIGEAGFGEFGMFVVADGMGGLADGQIASSIVVDALRNWWTEELSTLLHNQDINLNLVSDSLSTVINDANRHVIQYGENKGVKLGTTLSMIFISRDDYIVKHIGDSRIYMIEDNLKLITEDHSWVAEQVKSRTMTLEEAENHKNRNALTRCIGVTNTIDIFEHIGKIPQNAGIIVCSDGLYKLVDDHTISNIIDRGNDKQPGKLQNASIELLDLVKKNGAIDNVSIIIVYQNKERKKISWIKKFKEYFLDRRRG